MVNCIKGRNSIYFSSSSFLLGLFKIIGGFENSTLISVKKWEWQGHTHNVDLIIRFIKISYTTGNGEISFVQGVLKVREAMPLPVIREVKNAIPDSELVIIDCPPGNSCPMVESVRGADRVILVTEPTPFGLNDLGIALETLSEMGIPTDVVINRFNSGIEDAERLCRQRGIEVAAVIEESRELAEIGSRGGIAVLESDAFAAKIGEILTRVTSAGNAEDAV